MNPHIEKGEHDVLPHQMVPHAEEQARLWLRLPFCYQGQCVLPVEADL